MMLNTLAYAVREEIELVGDARRVSYIRVKDRLSKIYGLSSSELDSIKTRLKSLLREVSNFKKAEDALKIVFSTLESDDPYFKGRRRTSLLSTKESNRVLNPTYLFVALREYLKDQFENNEPSAISYNASKNRLLNMNFSREAIDIAKPVFESFFDRMFQIEQSENALRMLNESHELRSRIINGRLYLGLEGQSSMLPKLDLDSQYLNNSIVEIRDLISCTWLFELEA